jgi:hypothetical protein
MLRICGVTVYSWLPKIAKAPQISEFYRASIDELLRENDYQQLFSGLAVL